MRVLATGASPTLVAAIIAAAASIVSAAILAWVAFRAQSARGQIEEVRKIADYFSERIIEKLGAELHEMLDARTRGLAIAEIVRATLRDVLREHFGGSHSKRRWYD